MNCIIDNVCYYCGMSSNSCQNPNLKRIGVNSDALTLLILPVSFIDKTIARTSVIDAPHNVQMLWTGSVVRSTHLDRDGIPTRSPFPIQIEFEVKFECQTKIRLRAFGCTAIWGETEAGDTITFSAELSEKPWGLSFGSVKPNVVTGRIHPVYLGIAGQLSGQVVETAIAKSISCGDEVFDLASRIIESDTVVTTFIQQKMPVQTFLFGLHAPKTVEEGLNCLSLARKATVHQVRSMGNSVTNTSDSTYIIDKELISAVAMQPEKLSQGQRVALNTIRTSINSNGSSRILLNGDVGSGKTLVFLLAIAAVLRKTGGMGAVMVPSEIVANQVWQQACQRFPDLNPSLVTGSSKQFGIDAKLLIGTQALLSIEFPHGLEILVIDEQHKMSVDQRSKLCSEHTHLIESSATPIPRSLALALFDGWREARIMGCPVDKKINCHLLVNRSNASDIVRNHLRSKKKVIFVYPLVQSTKTKVKKREEIKSDDSVLAAFKRLNFAYPGQVIALHGQMKPQEKEAAVKEFASGTKPIAVASTVIEVGMDIPDIGCMVVVNADRFGVAQLHQLRGRLVRNGGHGDFVMLTKEVVGKDTIARLEAVRDTCDGFDLAERDLTLRGFGNLLGEMQSGGTDTLFKLPRLTAEDFLEGNIR